MEIDGILLQGGVSVDAVGGMGRHAFHPERSAGEGQGVPIVQRLCGHAALGVDAQCGHHGLAVLVPGAPGWGDQAADFVCDGFHPFAAGPDRNSRAAISFPGRSAAPGCRGDRPAPSFSGLPPVSAYTM